MNRWASRRCSSNREARGRAGYVESFDGKLQDELLNEEVFYTLLEAKVLVARWREHYSRLRLHSSLGRRPPAPAPEVIALPDPLGGPAPEPPASEP